MLIYSEQFYSELGTITDFIKADSVARALKFSDELFLKIEAIKNNPLAYPPFKGKNIRQLIYKKYSIPFEILENDIYILGIFKANIWSKKEKF